MSPHTTTPRRQTSDGLSRDARSYLSHASRTHLDCRQFGHAIRPTHDGYDRELHNGRTVNVQRLQCGFCGLVRVDFYDMSYALVSRDYDYPEGYQCSGLGEQLSRWNVRRWRARANSAARRAS